MRFDQRPLGRMEARCALEERPFQSHLKKLHVLHDQYAHP